MIDLDELRSAIDGDVVEPADEGWDEAVRGHNTATQHQPSVVVRAASGPDVAAAVAFASRNGLTVSVQNTGHGPSAIDRGGLLVRTDRLTGIDLNPQEREVRVGAGVRWGELMRACGAEGLAPLGMASVASVGVVGYTVGGGAGPLARAQGFAADHVRRVELVDADGRIQAVDPQSDPDLFWAVCGGRVGFGIVTSITLGLLDAPAVFTSTLIYSRADAAAALAAYATWQAELPDSTTTVAALFRFPDVPPVPEPLRGQRMLRIDLVDLDDARAAAAAVDRLAAAVTPASRDDATTDPAGWLRAQPPVPAGPSWQRSSVIDGLDAETVTGLLEVAGLETEAPWQVLELRPLGGALGRPPAVANSTGRWASGVLVNAVASGDPSGFARLPAAYAELVRRLGDRVLDGTLANFHGVAQADHPLAMAWPAQTHDRLERIRRERDPHGRFAASVPVG